MTLSSRLLSPRIVELSSSWWSRSEEAQLPHRPPPLLVPRGRARPARARHHPGLDPAHVSGVCLCRRRRGTWTGPPRAPSPPRAASPLAAPLSPPLPPPTNFAILARPSLAFSPAIPFLLFHPATNPYIDFTAFLCRPRPPPPPCPRARRGCAPARPWRQRGKCGTPASVPAASLLAGAPSPVLPAAGIAVSPPLPLQRPQPPLVAAVVGGR